MRAEAQARPVLLRVADADARDRAMSVLWTAGLGVSRLFIHALPDYGYLRGDTLAVLEPHQPAHFYRYAAPDSYTPLDPDPALGRIALAHALWPTWAYRHRAHTLPELRLPG